MSRCESLFAGEKQLRISARAYADTANDDTRRDLRSAAIAYAEAARAIEQCSFCSQRHGHEGDCS